MKTEQYTLAAQLCFGNNKVTLEQSFKCLIVFHNYINCKF